MFRIVFTLLVVLAVLSSTTLAVKLICDQPNEEYQCGSACQTTCETLGQPCPIVNIKCNDACYCKDGYARNRHDICIPIRYCPKQSNASNRIQRPSIFSRIRQTRAAK